MSNTTKCMSIISWNAIFFFVNAQMWESVKAPSFHRSSAQEIACTNEADWSDRVGKRCEDYRSRCDDPLALLLDSDWRAAALPKGGAAGPGAALEGSFAPPPRE